MTKVKDFLVKLYIYIFMIVFVFILFNIFYFIFSKGIFEINLEFLTENPKGMPLGTEGGIYQSIVGSFFLTILSMIISCVFGVSLAIFNVFYCKNKILNTFINLSIQTISSVPSILIGLFVYGFFIVTLRLQTSLLVASISLSIMVFPFVETNIEKILKDIDKRIIRDSFSLGIDKTYMLRKMLLPKIKKNIISTSLLAGSYAIGATAPLLLTGAVFITRRTSLMKPFMALPFHIHMLLSQSVATNKAFATSTVLIFILIILHILSEIILINIGGKIYEYITNKKS